MCLLAISELQMFVLPLESREIHPLNNFICMKAENKRNRMAKEFVSFLLSCTYCINSVLMGSRL